MVTGSACGMRVLLVFLVRKGRYQRSRCRGAFEMLLSIVLCTLPFYVTLCFDEVKMGFHFPIFGVTTIDNDNRPSTAFFDGSDLI